jgi:hypothetical protein
LAVYAVARFGSALVRLEIMLPMVPVSVPELPEFDVATTGVFAVPDGANDTGATGIEIVVSAALESRLDRLVTSLARLVSSPV